MTVCGYIQAHAAEGRPAVGVIDRGALPAIPICADCDFALDECAVHLGNLSA